MASAKTWCDKIREDFETLPMYWIISYLNSFNFAYLDGSHMEVSSMSAVDTRRILTLQMNLLT